MSREVFEWVEIDYEQCSRDYGTLPCTAALGTTGPRKCYKTRPTCQSIDNFLAGTPTTLRFSKVGVPIPPGLNCLAMLKNVAQRSATVNIAGSDPAYGQLGKRTSLTFTLTDRTHNDVGVDPYRAGRVDGTAQVDEPGYLPEKRGTYLAKLKARWPNYAKAAVRLKRALIVNNAVTDVSTYYYLMTEMDGPSKGEMRCEALGVVDLMNEKKSLCPKPSAGSLLADLTAVATSFSVDTGLGAGYATSGRLTIGSEIMSFTRTGDTFTVVRGQRGTTAASHSIGDTVQQNYVADLMRLDDLAYDLIVNYTEVPASYITFADWQAEVTAWAPSRKLSTDICVPTPVGTLLSELSDLGCTIWEDERAQKFRLKLNRPVTDGEPVWVFTDRNAKSIGPQEDLDEQRITQLLFFTKRFDPTKSLTDEANYQRKILTPNPRAQKIYDGVRTRKIFTRWLDQGDDTTAKTLSLRLLNRFENAPKRTPITLDARDKAISLMDVVQLSTVDNPDATGNATTQLMQVISRAETVPYHEVKVEVQSYAFGSRYARIAPNGTPPYSSASAAQKARYCALVASATPRFPDNSEGVRLV